MRTVCEVGFNWGHSAALWLDSNPNVRVLSFDRGAPQRSIDLLQRRFGAGRAAVSIALGNASRTTLGLGERAHLGLHCMCSDDTDL